MNEMSLKSAASHPTRLMVGFQICRMSLGRLFHCSFVSSAVLPALPTFSETHGQLGGTSICVSQSNFGVGFRCILPRLWVCHGRVLPVFCKARFFVTLQLCFADSGPHPPWKTISTPLDKIKVNQDKLRHCGLSLCLWVGSRAQTVIYCHCICKLHCVSSWPSR